MQGSGFDFIPWDAIGISSDQNVSPLMFLDSTNKTKIYDISARSNGSIRLSIRQASVHGIANYLGAIVSADRHRVYWVNESKPLP